MPIQTIIEWCPGKGLTAWKDTHNGLLVERQTRQNESLVRSECEWGFKSPAAH